MDTLLTDLWPYAERAGPLATLLFLALFILERRERLAGQERERMLIERVLQATEALKALRKILKPAREEDDNEW